MVTAVRKPAAPCPHLNVEPPLVDGAMPRCFDCGRKLPVPCGCLGSPESARLRQRAAAIEDALAILDGPEPLSAAALLGPR
jgi:hypothetical protein